MLKICILLLLSLEGINVWASSIAEVEAIRAKVYADPKLQSAIGYIKRGTMISVGDSKVATSRVLPVLIKGQKIAYVKTKDLNLTPSKKSIRSYTENKYMTHTSYFDYKRMQMSISGKVFLLGEKWDELSIIADNTRKINYGHEIKVRFESYDEPHGFDFRGGFNVMSVLDSQLTYQSITLAIDLVYNLYAGYNKYLYAVLSFGHSTYAKIKFRDQAISVSAIEAEGSLEFDYGLTHSWMVKIAGGYHYQLLSDFNLNEIVGPVTINMMGLHGTVGLIYRFDD